MITIKDKFTNKKNLIKVYDLPIGKFGSLNGHIVYRISEVTDINLTWLPGLIFIEAHNHLALWDAHVLDHGSVGNWIYMCEPIEYPDKKHCDNAIAIIRKMAKDNEIDGLSFIDHLYTLKQYIQDYLKRTKHVKP